MTDPEVWEEEYAAKFDASLWKGILGHAKPYRKLLIGMGAMGLVLASVDAMFPRVNGWIIDDAIRGGENLGPNIVLFLVLVVALATLVWGFINLAGRIVTGLAYDLRRDGFQRLQELSFSYYDKHSVGWLVSRLTSDVTKLAQIVPWALLDFVWGFSLVAMVSVMMIALQPKLGLLVLVIVPLMLLVSLHFQRKLLRSQRAVRRSNARITAAFNEAIMGVRTSKALVREHENLVEFQVESTQMYGHSVRNALQAAVYLPLIMTVGSLGVGLALWRGGILVGHEITLGTMVAFMQDGTLLSMPVQELAQRFAQMQAAQAAAERMQNLLDTVPEIADSPAVRARIAQTAAHADDLALLHGGERAVRATPSSAVAAVRPRREAHTATALSVGHDGSGREDRSRLREAIPGLAEDGYRARIERIQFQDVTFAYKAGETVLDRFNLEVRQGQTIALVGATGSGKSTIVSLLSRFYEPTSGRILLDGIEYRERSLHWLQSNLGIVLQTPHLFSGSVRENIRYGRLDATDGEVEEAARRVHAHGFIEELDGGYDSDVGERGDRLSVGQKQLVSLARAVLADPQILIMDEATSSVDTETERLIQAGIEELLRGRISFLIAHRLSTIRSADQILVIDHGKLTEQGSHRELLAAKGPYYRLYTNQRVEEGARSVLAATTA
ncbi:MAG: ABC transporter ATP-binding protein [Candidatus Eisenbacteria bacterium]